MEQNKMLGLLALVMIVISIRVFAKHVKSEDNAAFKKDLLLVVAAWIVVWSIILTLMHFMDPVAYL